jgi:outer membrane receptor protein involved in Fe transport
VVNHTHSLVLALLVPTPVLAQSAPAPDAEIVVTGRGLDQRPGDRAFDIVRIDAARIAENASDRLESVLGDVAGLQQFRRSDSRSANPTSQGISLRGIGGNASSRALLILDGVPQADPFGGWVAFPAYATDRIGAVRVTRGGGSGYYGAGALAGTVELESATPAEQPAWAAGMSYGSRGAMDARASALLRREGGFATVSAAFARGDGFIPTVRESRGAEDRAAPYRQASAAVRGVVRVGATTELQANLSAFSDTRERGTTFTRNHSDGADASLRLVGRGRWGWSVLGYLQARSFASQFASVDAARTTATQTLDQYNTPATGSGGRIELRPPLGAGLDLRLGGDWRVTQGRTQELYSFAAGAPTRRREAGGQTRTLGAFADLSIERGPLTLTAGGRVDRWRIADGFLREAPLATGAVTDTRFAERQGTEWTGRGGVAWTVAAPVTLRAAAYRGWRLPTLNELYRPFRVGTDATAANAALSPERLSGADVGVALKSGAFGIDATYFRNRLDDAIANVAAGTGPGTFPGVGFVGAGGVYRVRRNLDAIRSHGIEIDAHWRRGPVFALASWSRVSARVRADGSAAALDGLRPAQTPRDLASATLGWRDGGWGLSATLRHSGAQFEDDQNSRRLRRATTLDGYAALPLTRGVTLELRGENLFDTRVEAGISGANVVERATPRTLWLGVRLRAD